MKNTKQVIRPLYAIAYEIKKDWKLPNYAAKPYLEAMGSLNRIEDMYFLDSANMIVRYFLSNAASWKGEKARQIKSELKSMLASN
jgi:hypothetical protein